MSRRLPFMYSHKSYEVLFVCVFVCAHLSADRKWMLCTMCAFYRPILTGPQQRVRLFVHDHICIRCVSSGAPWDTNNFYCDAKTQNSTSKNNTHRTEYMGAFLNLENVPHHLHLSVSVTCYRHVFCLNTRQDLVSHFTFSPLHYFKCMQSLKWLNGMTMRYSTTHDLDTSWDSSRGTETT